MNAKLLRSSVGAVHKFAAVLTAALLATVSSAPAGNWDGDGTQGNFSWSENWYDNSIPSFNSSTDLRFNYNNESQTTITQDLGYWVAARDIVYEPTFSQDTTLTGANGFDLHWRIENYHSGNHTINAPISVKGMKFEINPINGNLTIGGAIYNNDHRTLQVYGDSGKTLTINSSLPGNGGLTVEKNSIVVLNANNTYTGTTTVSAGTLVVNGNQSSATGNVTVASGATLAGEGTVGGATTVSGTHAPGNGTAGDVGTQAFSNNLTYSSGSIFAWDLISASNSSGFDKVSGATGKTFASSGAFRVITGLDFAADTFWDTTQTWTTIFSGFGNLTGWASTAAAAVYNTSGTPLDVSSHGSFTINGITLTWTPIPELSNLLVGVLLGAGMMRRKRKNV